MFRGKTVAVTGGASGIGAAVAWKFGREGANLVILDFNEARMESISAELDAAGIQATAIKCDVSDEIQCVKAFKAAVRAYGGIDVLVNNAGITQRSLFRDTKIDVIRRVMEVNFYGSVNCTKAALEGLIERKGMIIVITSIAGVAPLYGRTGYSASKHALHGFFESLRCEVAELGVHVMMVSPGFTETNLQDRALDGNGSINTRPRTIPGSQDSPESVAERIFRGAAGKKRSIVLTTVGKLSYFTSRFFPRFYENRMIHSIKPEFNEADSTEK